MRNKNVYVLAQEKRRYAEKKKINTAGKFLEGFK